MRNDTNVLVNALANDTDADSANATLTGGVRFTPAAGYAGADSFQYRLTDELGARSGVITVSLTVTAPPGSGGSGGGGLDLLLLAALTAASYRRWRSAGSRR